VNFDKYQINIIGYEKTGKTSLACRYSQNRRPTEKEQSSRAFYVTPFVDDEPIQLRILESTDGLDYESFRSTLFPEAKNVRQCWLLMYSIDSRDSFIAVRNLLFDLSYRLKKTFFPAILIASKADLHEKRVIPIEEGKKLARKWGLRHISCSSHADVNHDTISKVFEQAIRLCKQVSLWPASLEHDDQVAVFQVFNYNFTTKYNFPLPVLHEILLMIHPLSVRWYTNMQFFHCHSPPPVFSKFTYPSSINYSKAPSSGRKALFSSNSLRCESTDANRSSFSSERTESATDLVEGWQF